MTSIAEKSQVRSDVSIIASQAPRATSMWPQKSPKPRTRSASSHSFRNASRSGRLSHPPTPAIATVASRRSFFSETWIGRPFIVAPPPRTAAYRSPSIEADARPIRVSPPTDRAISVAQIGMRAAKFFVPSIGSTIHRRSPEPWCPSSSPRIASPGNRSAIASRSIASMRVSASVTGEPSALRRTSNSRWETSRPTSAARSASSWAKASSRSQSAIWYSYLTTSVSTKRTPEALVKVAMSWVAAWAAGLAMSALKSSRESHDRTARPS